MTSPSGPFRSTSATPTTVTRWRRLLAAAGPFAVAAGLAGPSADPTATTRRGTARTTADDRAFVGASDGRLRAVGR